MPDEKVTNINETDNHNMSNSHVIDKKVSDIIQDAANTMTSNGHVTDYIQDAQLPELIYDTEERHS
jgi:hypothetical protein